MLQVGVCRLVEINAINHFIKINYIIKRCIMWNDA